jgi:hypothetical protein
MWQSLAASPRAFLKQPDVWASSGPLVYNFFCEIGDSEVDYSVWYREIARRAGWLIFYDVLYMILFFP